MAQAAATIPKAPSGRPSRVALARQGVAAFVAVLACYWTYSFLAVPMIEPGLEEAVRTTATREQIESARDDVTARQRDVAQYFSPGDWESDKPAIWKSGHMRLLFKTVEPNPDGTVSLNPCTLIFFPKDGDPAAPPRPVIMRAMEGARIRFDQPVELQNVDFGKRKFVGGALPGPIRISREASAPDAGDDLEITTRDLQMDGQRAWTDQPVNFRFGRSTASGRDLEILLDAAAGNGEADLMRGATLRTLKLNRDVQMQLEVGSGPLAGGAAGGPPPRGEPPVKITCQGPFAFEMETYAASFRDQVDVLRLNPKGPSDQLNCALLTVYFSRPGEDRPAAAAAPPAAGGGAMVSQVRLIEARGDPVTLRRPAQGMFARCHGIDFVPAVPGTASPGSMAAFGPGVIHANLPDDPAGKFVAQWARELRFEPDGPLQKATLRGATVVQIGQMGTITADEVFVWLSSKPPPPDAPPGQAQAATTAAWQVERVLAQRYEKSGHQSLGNVVIDAPQLHAVAATLEATVDRAMAQPGAAPAAGPPAAGPKAQPERRRTSPPQNPNERFEVTGRSVHIRMLPQGEQLAIASATIDQDAELQQFATAGGAKTRTLLVRGQQLHVSDAHTDDAKVTISGKPGFVEAGGMTLWGGVINLARRASRLWIDGPGRLTMPIAQDLDGQALPTPQVLTVDWKRALNFQTNTATFTGAVVARSGQQVLNTETLEAVLSRAVDFSNPRGAAPGPGGAAPELAEVRTRGATFVEARQLDEQGRQTSFSQMELADLSINRTTGKIAGRGPGWARHIARGAAPQILAPEQPADQPRAPAADQDQITYLHITFRQGIEGNIDRRRVRLFDETRTVYGPVPDWNTKLDANDPDTLGPRGMLLQADVLEVREMAKRPEGDRGWFELDGSGGVDAEGQRFTALGDRLTYVERKDQLILRGDPAEMYLEGESGAARSEVRLDQILYLVTRNYVSIRGARDINFEIPGDRQRSERPGR